LKNKQLGRSWLPKVNHGVLLALVSPQLDVPGDFVHAVVVRVMTLLIALFHLHQSIVGQSQNTETVAKNVRNISERKKTAEKKNSYLGSQVGAITTATLSGNND
jgi:hypothetical protein